MTVPNKQMDYLEWLVCRLQREPFAKSLTDLRSMTLNQLEQLVNLSRHNRPPQTSGIVQSYKQIFWGVWKKRDRPEWEIKQRWEEYKRTHPDEKLE